MFVRYQREGATAMMPPLCSPRTSPKTSRHSAPQVQAPTLVIHSETDKAVPFEHARRLAGAIPNATLAQYKGDHAPNSEPSTRSSPHRGLRAGPPTSPHRRRRTAARRSPACARCMFTDLVGHTEMMRRLGDDKGRDVLREHERITRELLREHAGTEVKTMGDGFMASFGSVTKAMDCAIALQRAFEQHSASTPEPLHVRVGLNAGEPIEEDGDLFGSTVIMASRIAAKAGAGEILIPEPLRHLLSGKSYVYADRGETMLKGFEDSVRLYEVRWQA